MSIWDNLSNGTRGRFYPYMLRSDIGIEAMLDMLEGKKHSTALHELRHGMFRARWVRGVRTVFSHTVSAYEGEAKMALDGKGFSSTSERRYSTHAKIEELYNFSLDLLRISSELRKTYGEGGERFSWEIFGRLENFGAVSRHFRSVLDGPLIEDQGAWSYYPLEGTLLVPDAQGRTLYIVMSLETRGRLVRKGVPGSERRALFASEVEAVVTRISGLLDRVDAQVEKVRAGVGDTRPGGRFHREVAALSRIVREEARR